MEKQIKENIAPINELDLYARKQDVTYSKFRDTKTQHIYGKKLENQAWGLVQNPNKPADERVAAYITTNLIKGKHLLGMELGRRKNKKTTTKRSSGVGHRQQVGKGLRKKQRRLKKKVD